MSGPWELTAGLPRLRHKCRFIATVGWAVPWQSGGRPGKASSIAPVFSDRHNLVRRVRRLSAVARCGTVIVLAAILVGCDPPPPPQPAEAATESDDPTADWVTFESRQGRFVVRLPAEPQTTMERTTADRGAVVNHLAQVEADGVVYGVSFADLPPSLINDRKVDVILRESARTVADRVGGRIAGSRDIEDATHPMRHVSIRVPGEEVARYMELRLTLVGPRLYQVTLVGEGAPQTGDESTADAFFESFEVREE